GKGPGSGGYVAELIIAFVPGNGVNRVRAHDAFDQGAGVFGQYLTLHFGGGHIVKDDDKGREVIRSAPEEDGPVEVEVQPEFELIVADILHVGTGDVDIEGWAWPEDLERIGSAAIGIYRIVMAQGNADLENLAGGGKARSQQGIGAIAEIQEVIYSGRDAQGIPDHRFVLGIAMPAPIVIVPLVVA